MVFYQDGFIYNLIWDSESESDNAGVDTATYIHTYIYMLERQY